MKGSLCGAPDNLGLWGPCDDRQKGLMNGIHGGRGGHKRWARGGLTPVRPLVRSDSNRRPPPPPQTLRPSAGCQKGRAGDAESSSPLSPPSNGLFLPSGSAPSAFSPVLLVPLCASEMELLTFVLLENRKLIQTRRSCFLSLRAEHNGGRVGEALAPLTPPRRGAWTDPRHLKLARWLAEP